MLRGAVAVRKGQFSNSPLEPSQVFSRAAYGSPPADVSRGSDSSMQ